MTKRMAVRMSCMLKLQGRPRHGMHGMLQTGKVLVNLVSFSVGCSWCRAPMGVQLLYMGGGYPGKTKSTRRDIRDKESMGQNTEHPGVMSCHVHDKGQEKA
ncbi:hypothetical protein Micbo1qcDRAFT_10515 [Microdochium bolleyi]|uniref:Uncharacterized protein n=1 Tax=Microdochium bolleyi TaxID=196109 RepID=A0A136IY84_9PEZI|nr:hypothetical protein Micbo1qcDRAFT_10515 [Microdochium bolleyi]